MWSYPYNVPKTHYIKKPHAYISHILGHEGKNSLFYFLKSKGLVTSLSAGCGISATDFSLFSISMNLTESGVGKVKEILNFVFSFLNMLKDVGPKSWIFDEISNIYKAKFMFLEKNDPSSYVSDLADRMHNYPPSHIISAPYSFEEFDPELIKTFTSNLTPESMRININSKLYDKENTAQFSSEPWYNTQYRIHDIPAEWIKVFEI